MDVFKREFNGEDFRIKASFLSEANTTSCFSYTIAVGQADVCGWQVLISQIPCTYQYPKLAILWWSQENVNIHQLENATHAQLEVATSRRNIVPSQLKIRSLRKDPMQ